METTPANPPGAPQSNRTAARLLALVMLVAGAARAWLQFSTPLVPGINGAYYLVQTRALLEHGHLGIPDFPLTFWVDAVLAKLVQIFSGLALEPGIVLAVKLEDAILPALVAWPVFALVRRWTARNGGGLWLPTFAALAVAAGAPALSMVGDFQKNSLGLVWLAALLWRLHCWLDEPRARNAALAVLLLALCGLTHIGVFGWALVLTAATLAVALVRSGRQVRRQILLGLAVGGGACALASALVLWKYDPARVQRLTQAITHPLSFISPDQGQRGNRPKLDAPNPQRPAQNDFRPQPPRAGGRNHFGRPPGDPGGLMMLGRFGRYSSVAFLTAAAGALAALWFCRKKLSAGDIAVVGGCALGLIALGGPWITGDKVMRFALIAVGPAVVCTAFALTQLPWPKTRGLIMALLALALVVPGINRAKAGGRPVITLAAAAELRSIAATLPAPEKTLIVARHGLEWWAAWLLHTHIAHADAITDSDWEKYDQIYFLRQKAGMQLPGGPRPGLRQFPPDAGSPGFGMPRLDGPGFGGPDFGGGRPPAGNFPPRFGPPRGGGAMAEPMIPRNATITHDGECFTLARVLTPVRRPTPGEDFRPPLPPRDFP